MGKEKVDLEFNNPHKGGSNMPLLIVKRIDHYEVHYEHHVEFWDLDVENKLGESKCYEVK